VDPFDLPEGSNFSMAAGDFLEVYQESGTIKSYEHVFDIANDVFA
jgi:hypothetical protein